MSKRRVSGIILNMTMRGVDISDREIDLTSEYCDTVEISYYSNLVFW